MTRGTLITLIHVGKSDLKLDDDTYQDMLENITGLRSSKQMSQSQLTAVLEAMKEAGFKPLSRKKGFSKSDRFCNPQHRKAFALWLSLYESGIASENTVERCNEFICKTTKVNKVVWLTPQQWNMAIEALKAWCRRKGVDING